MGLLPSRAVWAGGSCSGAASQRGQTGLDAGVQLYLGPTPKPVGLQDVDYAGGPYMLRWDRKLKAGPQAVVLSFDALIPLPTAPRSSPTWTTAACSTTSTASMA
jgi:hypothetical protein